MLSGSKQSVVSKKQSVACMQQLKLILNFNHKQKEFKADEVKHFKEDVPSRPRALTKVKVRDTVGPIEGPKEGGLGVAKRKRRHQEEEASPVQDVDGVASIRR